MGDILPWVTGSPGSAAGQSCVLPVGAAYGSASYPSSEAVVWVGATAGLRHRLGFFVGRKCGKWEMLLLSGNAGYFQISWTLLHGGADGAGMCLVFKGKPVFEHHLFSHKRRKSVHQCSQHCRPVFPGLLTGLGRQWPKQQEESCKAEDGLVTLLRSPVEVRVPALAPETRAGQSPKHNSPPAKSPLVREGRVGAPGHSRAGHLHLGPGWFCKFILCILLYPYTSMVHPGSWVYRGTTGTTGPFLGGCVP